jgi:heme/copper-type cytochrome/quinol oxidase subunit 2
MRMAIMLIILGVSLMLFGIATTFLERDIALERLKTQPGSQPPTTAPPTLPFLGIGLMALGVFGVNTAAALRRQSERITDLEIKVAGLQYQVDVLSRPDNPYL